MKILKRLFIALIVLVVLFVGAGFAASRYINKELIEKQVSEATGREFKIEGELKPVISLTPSVKAEKVSMANASWGTRPQLATIGSFEVKVQLIPLLSKKIVIDKIVIDNADIQLEKKGDKWNFDFDNAADKSQTEKEKPVADKKPLSFDISGLEITNSHLVIKQGGEPTDLNVKSLKFAPHKDRMALDFDGVVNKRALKVSADLPPVADLMGGKAVDINSLVLQSDDLKVNADASIDMSTKKAVIKTLDVKKGDISLSAKGDANIDTKKINLSSLSFSQGNMKFSGTMAVDAGGAKPYIKGALSADTIDLPAKSGGGKSADGKAPAAADNGQMFSDDPLPFDSFDAANADLTLKIAHFKSGNIAADNISAAVKLNNGVLSLSPLNASFADGQIAGNIVLSKSATRIGLKGSNLSMEKILAETAGLGDFKNGKTDLDISLAGSGNSVAKIMGSLSGTSHVSLGKATYSGEILKGRAAQLTSLLRSGNSNEIEINCAVADINWASGTGSFTKVGADTGDANLTSTGNLKFPSGALNIELDPVSKLAKLNNLAIPFGVTGTIKDPHVNPLTSKVAGKAINNAISMLTAPKQDGKKKGFKVGNLLGVDKNATVTSPCGAAPVTVPAATNDNTAPAATGAAAPATTAPPAPATAQAPAQDQPLSKKEKKKQQLNNAIKQLGF